MEESIYPTLCYYYYTRLNAVYQMFEKTATNIKWLSLTVLYFITMFQSKFIHFWAIRISPQYLANIRACKYTYKGCDILKQNPFCNYRCPRYDTKKVHEHIDSILGESYLREIEEIVLIITAYMLRNILSI